MSCPLQDAGDYGCLNFLSLVVISRVSPFANILSKTVPTHIHTSSPGGSFTAFTYLYFLWYTWKFSSHSIIITISKICHLRISVLLCCLIDQPVEFSVSFCRTTFILPLVFSLSMREREGCQVCTPKKRIYIEIQHSFLCF